MIIAGYGIPIILVLGFIFAIRFCIRERKHFLMSLIILMFIFLAFIFSGPFIVLIKNIFS